MNNSRSYYLPLSAIANLTPDPSPARDNDKTGVHFGRRGELRREGALPPLYLFPPLEHKKKVVF